MEIRLESAVEKTARVLQVAGMFDLPAGGVTATIIRCPVPGADEAWTVGLVTGPSGCGKSTLARRAFPGAVWCGGEPWPSGRAVVDGFPPGLGVGEVVELLGGVGLNSPPAWLRPYAALSVGQQWRADLARGLALARQQGVVACADEFTSVVDRDTARAGSAAAARLARRLGVRLVAVGCHDDILEWLDPDWVARPAEGACARRALQGRPKVRLDVFRCRVQAWDLFREHHYLSHSISNASVCFMAACQGRPVGFSAWLPFVGRGPPARREHRTVVLPAWQGVGAGMALSGWVASLWRGLGYRAISATAHPGYARARLKSDQWKLTRPPGLAARGKSGLEARLGRASTRLTAGFEFVGPPMNPRQARELLMEAST